MNILIIDIDSTIPNLALKKVEKYHRERGDSITFDPKMRMYSDKIYVSCVFPENKEKCEEWENDHKAIIGGTGYDIKVKLPPEIESIKPKINWGFTTRGCIRKCKFCFVQEKEGITYVVGDIYDIWDGESKQLFIMDNNILSAPTHFIKIAEQLREEKLKVDFNQGLDHRLLTDGITAELMSLKYINGLRFSLDSIQELKSAEKAVALLKEHGLKKYGARWYVYVSKDDTFDTVFPRLEFLHKNEQLSYLMRDREIHLNPMWIALSKWCNFGGAFKKSFWEILNTSKEMQRYVKYFKEYKL